MSEEMREVIENLLTLIEGKQWSALRAELSEMNAVDIAMLFEELNREQALLVFHLLPKKNTSTTLWDFHLKMLP